MYIQTPGNIELRGCCSDEGRYIIRFAVEPTTIFCEEHFSKKKLVDVISIHDMKLNVDVTTSMKLMKNPQDVSWERNERTNNPTPIKEID